MERALASEASLLSSGNLGAGAALLCTASSAAGLAEERRKGCHQLRLQSCQAA